MGAKAEIGWTTTGEDGVKRHVYARKVGKDWRFFARPKRKGKDIEWVALENPPLTDWLELYESIRRRAGRDLNPPDHVQNVKRLIQERFPEHPFEA